MPDLEVGAARTRAPAALVDRDELIVVQLQEGDRTLHSRFARLDIIGQTKILVYRPFICLSSCPKYLNIKSKNRPQIPVKIDTPPKTLQAPGGE